MHNMSEQQQIALVLTNHLRLLLACPACCVTSRRAAVPWHLTQQLLLRLCGSPATPGEGVVPRLQALLVARQKGTGRRVEQVGGSHPSWCSPRAPCRVEDGIHDDELAMWMAHAA
jgi:hypothetical protein